MVEKIWENAVENHDVVLYADSAHFSGSVRKIVGDELPSLAQQGYSNLSVELDPNETRTDLNAVKTPEEMKNALSGHPADAPEAEMLAKAKANGYAIQQVDDLGHLDDFVRQYPDQKAVAHHNEYINSEEPDKYLATLPQEQRAALDEFALKRNEVSIQGRNKIMADNIEKAFTEGGKTVAFVGGAHAPGIEKELEDRGLKVLNVKAIDPDHPDTRTAERQADLIMDANTGKKTLANINANASGTEIHKEAQRIANGERYPVKDIPPSSLMKLRPGDTPGMEQQRERAAAQGNAGQGL